MAVSRSEVFCTICPNSCEIAVEQEGGELLSISGNRCARGRDFAAAEVNCPTRVLTTTVPYLSNGVESLLPVRTSRAVPRETQCGIVRVSRGMQVRGPVAMGQVLVKNVLNTGADLIASCSRK